MDAARGKWNDHAVLCPTRTETKPASHPLDLASQVTPGALARGRGHLRAVVVIATDATQTMDQ